MAISLQQLKAFQTVATCLSFSEAAKQLYSSQPHVSMQIAKLEAHLGVRLFVRSRPQVALTQPGRNVLEMVVRIMNQLDELESISGVYASAMSDTIKAAVVATVGNNLMPNILKTFTLRHPDAHFDIKVGNTDAVNNWFDTRWVDLAITPTPPRDGDLEVDFFYREDLVVIHSALRELPHPLTLELFLSLPKVLREPGSSSRALLLKIMGNKPMRCVAEVTGSTAVNQAVMEDVGVALVPKTSTSPWEEAGLLRSTTIADLPLSNDFFLVRNASVHLPLSTATFVDYLLDLAATHAITAGISPRAESGEGR